jgi:glucose/arabinose dehydrogenase
MKKMFGKFYFAAACLLVMAACDSSDGKTLNETAKSRISLTRLFPELNFSRPIWMVQQPDGGSEWYILEQSGGVHHIDADSGKKNPILKLEQFYDISDCGECGLLGMAFHPDFKTNGFIYLSFTEGSGDKLTSYVARFRSADKGLSFAFNAGAPERTDILKVAQPYTNHNGGHIAFGPDRFLYIGLGDGGSANDPPNHGQDKSTLLGSMLRLRDDGSPAPGNLAQKDGALPEIYAYGLRNPWRWSFDRKTGDLWAGDVGQNLYEEVDIVRNGLNYGWRCYEGFHRTENACGETGPLEPPVAEYGRKEGVSITGGYVYRGKAIADLAGAYIFGDYGSGRIWALRPESKGDYKRELLLESGLNISSFAEDHTGELYVIDHGGGLFKIQ